MEQVDELGHKGWTIRVSHYHEQDSYTFHCIPRIVAACHRLFSRSSTKVRRSATMYEEPPMKIKSQGAASASAAS